MGASELTASAKALGSRPAEGSPTSGQAEQLAPLRNAAGESLSPFVRSFADSPVAWQPLDNATVERAKKEHKLIFLHIAYKACHHCHLMVQESFSNSDVAHILNDSFIPIVVDRDERPDLDTIYMNYVQAVSKAGGWPLNLFLTPNLEPVLGGTYWPGPGTVRRNRGDTEDEVLDFLTIIKRVHKIWRDQEARCRKEATEILGQLREFAAEGTLGTRNISGAQAIAAPGATPSAAVTHLGRTSGVVSAELDLDQLEEAFTHISGTFDPVYAGFGLAPKFLTPPKLAFLLQLSQFPGPVQDVVGETECKHAATMALDTLRQIASSSLRDHVGATGFSRCSVTPDWSIPNFEKLVADNALLLSLFTEAWKQSGGREDSEFFNTVIELGDYLSSPPIALPEGGFATAEAADSYAKRGDQEKREGAYYLWTRREFDLAIDSRDKQAGPVAAAYFGVLQNGNVDEDHDPKDEYINQNILQVKRTPEDISKQFHAPIDKVLEYISIAKTALKERRDRERVRPELDDKVVTGWNGLVIGGLAYAGAALREIRPDLSQKYINVAQQAVTFILQKLWDGENRILYRVWKDTRFTEAFADDYAYLISGLLELFHATRDESLLEFADILQSKSPTPLPYFPTYQALTTLSQKHKYPYSTTPPSAPSSQRSPTRRTPSSASRTAWTPPSPPSTPRLCPTSSAWARSWATTSSPRWPRSPSTPSRPRCSSTRGCSRVSCPVSSRRDWEARRRAAGRTR